MKKILALAVALMMVLAVMAPALADTLTAGQDQDSNFGDSTTGKAAIGDLSDDSPYESYTAGIEHAIFNVHFDIPADATKRPQTKFSYSIANGTAVAATATTPGINAGIGGVTFHESKSATTTWDSVNGTTDTDTIQLDFAAATFAAAQPGIYRYTVTQADMTAEQTALGIANGNLEKAHTDKVLYLDVYVNDINGTKTVTGAVLSPSDAAPQLSDQHDNGTMDLATYTNKVDGFYNSYKTYTVTIEKDVTGDAADTSTYFPFTLNLGYKEPDTDDANTTVNGVTVTVTNIQNAKVNSSETANSTATTTVGTYTASSDLTSEGGTVYTGIQLKDDGKVTVSGLPLTVLVRLMETVDAGEGYTISSVVTTLGDNAALNASAKKNTETTYTTKGFVVDDSEQANESKMNIKYTNNRPAISPTGVVLRYAPYIVMVGIAAFLLVMAARRRKDTQDKSSSI